MFIHLFCLCPLGLATKLNFNISKEAYCFIRSKKADNNGISLLLMCEPSLFTNKRTFKTKRKFKDLSQFRQNKNQYCTDTCVCNFARTLDCISFPLLYKKKRGRYKTRIGSTRINPDRPGSTWIDLNYNTIKEKGYYYAFIMKI